MGGLEEKPDGGFFFQDAHFSGQASRLRLLQVNWGRLVDVYDVDTLGRTNPVPVLRDVVIPDGVLSDGSGLTLEVSPVTHDARLIVQRTRGAPIREGETFESILTRATDALGPVFPKSDDGVALPVSFVARNAALMLSFDDLLDDGPEAQNLLVETVRLTRGYPPRIPQPARVFFDPSHGAILDGQFHSTRVIVDFTVSESDARGLPYFVPVNAAGMPAGSPGSPLPNGAVHLPTSRDEGTGRFFLLANLAGHPLIPEGPVEAGTQDLVRAFRVGNAEDPSAGYLLDLSSPTFVSDWDIVIERATKDPDGVDGFTFAVDLVFANECQAQPRAADLIQIGTDLYELREGARAPDRDGRVTNVKLRRVDSTPLDEPAELLGAARYLTPFAANSGLHPACWVTFTPAPLNPPSQGISSDARVSVRFSEPMDPSSFRAFDSFSVVRRDQLSSDPQADAFIVGSILPDQNLQRFSFVPRLPLTNQGRLEYRVLVDTGESGLRDLQGNAPQAAIAQADFELDPAQAPVTNGGLVMRFEGNDELAPFGFPDLRGQITYDANGGILRPRRPVFASYQADRSVPLVNIMGTWALGIQTPLSSLGSKLQVVWRYCDFGFRVRDERFYNLDLEGLSWSPLNGDLNADFFPEFEMRLAHSQYLPDETVGSGGAPKYPDSGLVGGPRLFEENFLVDPLAAPVVVHPRGLGYRIRPADLTLSPSGTPFLAFPWNQGAGARTSFTWRDTDLLAKGGRFCPGIPLDIEVGTPLNLDVGIGEVAPSAEVPSIGLPLLLEVRCFPSSLALGFNSLDIRLPYAGWPTPNFRAFSTGGIDQTGTPVFVDPDRERIPKGGYNPNSNPPGQRTPLSADNSFYVAQIDTVMRVSRAVTVWMQSGSFAPHWVEPVIEPRTQIDGTAITVDYRGADGFSSGSGNAPFDARVVDIYGDFQGGTVQFHGDRTWKSDVSALDGATFVQVRFTFLNNVDSGLSPELDSFGLAFEER